MAEDDPDPRKVHVAAPPAPTDQAPLPVFEPSPAPVPAPEPEPGPRRWPGSPGQRAVVGGVLLAILVGGFAVGVATRRDGVDAASTSTSEATTTTAPTTTTTAPTTTTTVPLATQVDDAIHGRPGPLVTGAHVNIIHNLTLDTSLGETPDDVTRALDVCHAGQEQGYPDVKVRSATKRTLVSTGLFDNDCQRQI